MKYNYFELFKAYNENKDLIYAYYKNKPIERYSQKCQNDPNPDQCEDEENAVEESTSILGLSIGLFMFFFIIYTILFIMSVVLLVTNWSILPDWAKIAGIIAILFFNIPGTIFTIITVSVIKSGTKNVAQNK